MDDGRTQEALWPSQKCGVRIFGFGHPHTEWDGCEDVRDRLRGGGGLLVDGKGEDIKVVLSNSSVLQPLVTRMSLCQSRPLPNVDALRDEVEQVYLKNKRGQTPEDQPDVIAISWKIRKLLTYLKMKVRRKEVSSVPRFKCNMWIWRNWKMVWNFFVKNFVRMIPYYPPIQGACVSAHVLDDGLQSPGLGLIVLYWTSHSFTPDFCILCSNYTRIQNTYTVKKTPLEYVYNCASSQ